MLPPTLRPERSNRTDTRMPMQRLLLLETLNQDRYHHLRVEYFPLILGLAREVGWEATWWTLVVDPELMHREARFTVSLAASQMEALEAEMRAWAPTLVVVHDRSDADLIDLVQRCAPEARLADLTTLDMPRWGEVGPADPESEEPRELIDARLLPNVSVDHLLRGLSGSDEVPTHPHADAVAADVVQFVFERRVVGPCDLEVSEQPVRLLLDHICRFYRPVRTNPCYAGLSSSYVAEHVGCAFCPKATGPPVSRERDAVAIDLAMRQIVAHQAGEGGAARHREYYFEDAGFNTNISGLLDAAVDRGIAPSTFTTMLRADVLLGQRAALEQSLPRAAEAGHGIRLMSIGAESFSEAENVRFNKALSPRQLWDCFDMIQDFEARFPNAFGCVDPGYFSTILFTPWTLPEDLLINIRAARKLGLEFLKRTVGTRLQLFPRLPITELAAHDGLLVSEGGDARDIPDSNLWNAELDDIQWRFADPLTERAQRLLVRLDPIPEQVALDDGDPLLAEIRQARAELPPRVAGDYVALAEAVVHAVVTLGVEASGRDVIAHAATIAEPSLASDAAESEASWLPDGSDGINGAPMGAADRTSSWLDQVVAGVRAGSPSWLAGYRIVDWSVCDEDGTRQLHINLDGDRGSLGLCVEDLAAGSPAWVRGARFTARYSGELPPDSAVERQLTTQLLAELDRGADVGGIGALQLGTGPS